MEKKQKQTKKEKADDMKNIKPEFTWQIVKTENGYQWLRIARVK